MSVRRFVEWAGFSLLLLAAYLHFLRPITVGVLDCGTVEEPRHYALEGFGVLAENACSHAQDNAMLWVVITMVVAFFTLAGARLIRPNQRPASTTAAATTDRMSAPVPPGIPALPRERQSAPLTDGPYKPFMLRGWYPDPWDTQRIRYWDGTSWSSGTAPRPPGN
ncbi:DUF2510 domain-containing protein [Rhodococcus sp. PSBB049]|nr:DUF2510 domain-containing protein [Rhodococcus sp. PSBB049]